MSSSPDGSNEAGGAFDFLVSTPKGEPVPPPLPPDPLAFLGPTDFVQEVPLLLLPEDVKQDNTLIVIGEATRFAALPCVKTQEEYAAQLKALQEHLRTAECWLERQQWVGRHRPALRPEVKKQAQDRALRLRPQLWKVEANLEELRAEHCSTPKVLFWRVSALKNSIASSEVQARKLSRLLEKADTDAHSPTQEDADEFKKQLVENRRRIAFLQQSISDLTNEHGHLARPLGRPKVNAVPETLGQRLTRYATEIEAARRAAGSGTKKK